MSNKGAQPEWWERNATLKEEMGLPTYEPPRFKDGTHTHEIVAELEETHDCDVRFVGFDTEYPDDWTAVVNGEHVASVGRHRDSNGNTVFEIESSAFKEMVLDGLEVDS